MLTESFLIVGPRTAYRPQNACGRYCPWEPTALNVIGQPTPVVRSHRFGRLRESLERSECQSGIKFSKVVLAWKSGGKRRFSWVRRLRARFIRHWWKARFLGEAAGRAERMCKGPAVCRTSHL